VRRPFYFLLIALLLLRGWIGEAMATDMAASWLQPAQSATKTIAAHAYGTWARASFYHQTASSGLAHAGHGAGAMAGAGDCADQPLDTGAQPAGGHCGVHGACQACYTLAPSAAVAQLALVVGALTRPSTAAARFASADAASDQKPPIA
jgi:hypothetical protein